MSSIACFAWLSSSKIGWSRIVRFIPDSSKLGHHLLANSLPMIQILAIPCRFSLGACNLIHRRGTLGKPVGIDMLLVNESVGHLMSVSSNTYLGGAVIGNKPSLDLWGCSVRSGWLWLSNGNRRDSLSSGSILGCTRIPRRLVLGQGSSWSLQGALRWRLWYLHFFRRLRSLERCKWTALLLRFLVETA